MSVIGCTDNYAVMIMRQPGNMTTQGSTPAAIGEIVELTSLQWGRVDNEISAAEVVFTKCPTNCSLLAPPELNWTGVDPWAHEIWIYRNGLVAWMGPIVYIRERPDEFVIQARDMIAWIGHREIINFYTRTDTPAGIAYDLLQTFFPPSDPDLLGYVAFLIDSPATLTVEYDRAQYVILDKWRDLVSAGLHFTTMTRNVLISGRYPANSDNPYVLNASDILGDCEIIKDGLNYGDHIVGLGEGLTFGIGPTANDLAYFGKVTYPPTRFNDIRVQAELDGITAEFYNDMRNLTPELVVPSQSALSSETEIINTGFNFVQFPNQVALQDLICGMRYDVQVDKPFCTPAMYPMRLVEVQVTWDAKSGEKIAVSLGKQTPIVGG